MKKSIELGRIIFKLVCVKSDTVIGLAITAGLKPGNELDLVHMLAEQANDCREVMESVLGKQLTEEIIKFWSI